VTGVGPHRRLRRAGPAARRRSAPGCV